jgi:PAS domain-containing protein
MKATRSAGFILELFSWIFVVSTGIMLAVRWQNVSQLQTNKASLDRLPEATVGPRRALLSLREAALKCAYGAPSADGVGYFRGDREDFTGVFNIYYHALIDVQRFTAAEYPPRISVRFGRCIAPLMLGRYRIDATTLDSRILWMYVFLERKSGSSFVVWPDSEIPTDFRPQERPWYRKNIEKVNRKRIQISEGNLYETFPFLDAFTGEQIISLSLPEELSDGSYLTTVVDVQAGPTPTIYSRMLCLNLLMAFAILILSFLVKNSFRSYYSKCWYRAWLGVACLYSVSAYAYFGEWGSGSFFAAGGLSDKLLPLFSMLNNVFFLLTALVLWKPSAVKAQRRIALRVGFLSVLLFFAAWMFEENRWPKDVSLRECVEAIFSAVVLLAFALALIAVLRGCASSLDPIRWAWRPRAPGFIEFRWAPIGSVMIACFFIAYALLQLSIPLWRLRPWLGDLFLFASVPMKVGFAAVFYSVVLIELYWEKFRANQVFIASISQGIITVDEGFKVMTANEIAVSLINLPAEVMRGLHLRQILFRSLFEAERVFRAVAAGNTVEGERIRGKRFRDGVAEIEEADYWVTASVVGRGVAGRTKALFVISDAAPPQIAGKEDDQAGSVN